MQFRESWVFTKGKDPRKNSFISRNYDLKEQYPVTAHARNFDFLTRYGETERCEESKKTLKNPVASRLAEVDTALKLLRITDQ